MTDSNSGLPPRKRRRLGDEEDEVVLVEDGKLYGFGEGIDERLDIDFGLDGTAGNFGNASVMLMVMILIYLYRYVPR